MQVALTRLMNPSFRPRLYQETILATAAAKNTLVVLPTGMGKTAIAALLAAQRLAERPGGKILLVAPTKPLVDQHLTSFSELLNIPAGDMAVFTGDVPPEERARRWSEVRIVFSTPQGLENDIISGKAPLRDVVLLIVDEAHRATGDYSYVFLAKRYHEQAEASRILALTASPGADIVKIEEVCRNLFVEAVEIRTENDPDVRPYIQEVEMQQVRVELPPELMGTQRLLSQCVNSKLSSLRECGVRLTSYVNKTELLKLQRGLHAQMSSGERDFSVMKALSLIAETIKVQHALELLETQGVGPLVTYMDKIVGEAATSKVKAVQNLVADANFKAAHIKARSLQAANVEHPKIPALKRIIGEEIAKDPSQKIIVFTQFRDTGSALKRELATLPGVLPELFVGQAKKGETGLSQKKQIEMLDQFRDGLFNVLIATSVAEEGLDIPRVDIVIFYEPVPSAIRTIQRRGRTGRQDKGRVIMLITKGTRDEGYHWGAKHKERRMQQSVDGIRKALERKSFVIPKKEAQPTLAEYVPGQRSVTIFADYREKGRGVLKMLSDQGINLKLEMLQCADYLCSPRVGVEVKDVGDFVDSIVDGRLVAQLKELRRNFERPLVLVQGTQDIYAVRNVHPNAIRGMLAAITVSFGIPIIHTKTDEETAAFLLTVAKREQEEFSSNYSPHADKKPMSTREAQEYLVSAVPSVGPSLAKELLVRFGSVQAVFNASEEALKAVPGVGDKIAGRIVETARARYEPKGNSQI